MGSMNAAYGGQGMVVAPGRAPTAAAERVQVMMANEAVQGKRVGCMLKRRATSKGGSRGGRRPRTAPYSHVMPGMGPRYGVSEAMDHGRSHEAGGGVDVMHRPRKSTDVTGFSEVCLKQGVKPFV